LCSTDRDEIAANYSRLTLAPALNIMETPPYAKLTPAPHLWHPAQIKALFGNIVKPAGARKISAVIDSFRAALTQFAQRW
jgi:hypothetical protein